MNKILFRLLFFIFLAASTVLSAQSEKKYDPATGFQLFLEFDNPSVELGEVKHGEKRSFDYTFTNITDEPVTIELVSACSCTTTEYSTKAISPGGKGKIEIVFDSTEKEESETIGVDIFFVNRDVKNDMPGMQFVEYDFTLIK